jgi:uncharacterized protein (DUF433 family)
MQHEQLITIEAGKRGGKPCIRGMRITVYDVLEYLASGMTTQEILDDFPYLTNEDVLACLRYAAERERSTVAVQHCCVYHHSSLNRDGGSSSSAKPMYAPSSAPAATPAVVHAMSTPQIIETVAER